MCTSPLACPTVSAARQGLRAVAAARGPGPGEGGAQKGLTRGEGAPASDELRDSERVTAYREEKPAAHHNAAGRTHRDLRAAGRGVE